MGKELSNKMNKKMRKVMLKAMQVEVMYWKATFKDDKLRKN